MNFGQIIEGVKQGKKAQRKGWNGKGMYIFNFSNSNFCIKECEEPDKFLGSTEFFIEDGYIGHIGFEDDIGNFYSIGDFLLLKTAGNKCIPWVASQEDVLAEDWEFVD